MSLLKIVGEKLPPSQRSSLEMILKSNIEISVFHISCFISVCPFVYLSKEKFAENSHVVLSSLYYKAFIFHLFIYVGSYCVEWFIADTLAK